ncbi:DUF1232 domain-containing protein [Sphaerotilaceae bacterium SBD11-9]
MCQVQQAINRNLPRQLSRRSSSRSQQRLVRRWSRRRYGSIWPLEGPKHPFGQEAPAWAPWATSISPLDAIPDVVTRIGFADDLGVLALAVATVAAPINNEVRAVASKKMSNWVDLKKA